MTSTPKMKKKKKNTTKSQLAHLKSEIEAVLVIACQNQFKIINNQIIFF